MSRSATLACRWTDDRSARSVIGSAFMTGSPKRDRITATRSGGSRPCSCSRSGFKAAMHDLSSSSLASTETATLRARFLTRSPSVRAASKPTWRGDGGKNTNPTRSAPASSAASRAVGVFRPQILIITDMGAPVGDGSPGFRAFCGNVESGPAGPASSGRGRDHQAQPLPVRRGRREGAGALVQLGAQDLHLRRRAAAEHHPDDQQRERDQVEGLREHQGRIGLIERIKRDSDDLAVGDRKGDQNQREQDQNQRREGLADHGQAAKCWFVYGTGRLSRSRISLPVLKNGTDFWSTETWAPVRGLRPERAGRCFTENAPKPRSSTRSPRAMAAMISPRMALTMVSTSRW